jgi:hypothetical protein
LNEPQSYLTKLIDSSNVIACKRVGELYSCDALTDVADNFVVRNFEEVFRQNPEDFCRQVDKVDELRKWFLEDSLFVPSEDFLLEVNPFLIEFELLLKKTKANDFVFRIFNL